MAATVKLRFGDLFDGPADLIVLPCSTGGTVTRSIAMALAHHSIPHPRGGMQLGELDIRPFDGGEDIAQFVAFAASVKGMGSSFEAIERIGATLGAFTREEPSVRSLSAPLLGAGAGGIQSEKAVAALKAGFLSSADPGATLIIHILQREVFERLQNGRQPVERTPQTTLRVFLSHTSKTEEDVEWVKQVALFLMEKGIQARLDKFHLRRGMDLPQWMCNELALADKVIVICDEAYSRKADGRLGGVGWETMIIQGDLAALPPDSTKYQVVVRAADVNQGLPMYLRTRYVFHAPAPCDVRSFGDELLRELLDLPLDERLAATQFAV